MSFRGKCDLFATNGLGTELRGVMHFLGHLFTREASENKSGNEQHLLACSEITFTHHGLEPELGVSGACNWGSAALACSLETGVVRVKVVEANVGLDVVGLEVGLVVGVEVVGC